MNSQELLRLFRSDVSDEAAPPLWSDVDIYSYIDDAQKQFCRLTGGIPDASTAEVTEVVAIVAAPTVELHESILKIRAAYRTSDGREVEIVNYEDMPAKGLRFDGSDGPVRRLVIGMDENVARWLPIPDAQETVQLVVDRLPLCEVTASKAPQKLEVSHKHHHGLMHWMKARAYGKQDAETYNKVKSVEFEAKFRQYCADAKQEKDRKKHKTRVVQYGGLPMAGVENDYGVLR